jgi:tetraacyldisaccharide 4'-kinase
VVAFLAARLLQAGERAAVLSRGHGRVERAVVQVAGPRWPAAGVVGDEPLLLARRHPGLQVWVGADRVELARRALASGATVALLDDGFQHRRLGREVDLVVVDEAVGLGNGHLLPWGPLREPWSSLRRASVVWVRVAERPVALPEFPSGVTVVRARHAAVDVVEPGGVVRPLSALAGRRVIGFCGIARPSSFERTLAGLGAEVVEMRDFADHHLFRPDELSALRAAAEKARAELVTTEKDAVRLSAEFLVWVVRLGVAVVEGELEIGRLVAG